MKKWMLIPLLMAITILPGQQVQAQIPIVDIIKGAIKKVIKAADLQIQRKQNKVIWLQNAQKTLENAMAKLKLEEIAGWTEKQRNLYKDYFEELQKVKTILAYYRRISDITKTQVKLVTAYKQAWQLVQQDNHFNASELDYISKVYTGIIGESLKNLDQVYMVTQSFQTQMSDADRMELIDEAARNIDRNYTDLQVFTRSNITLSLQRAREQNDIGAVKKLYGIQ